MIRRSRETTFSNVALLDVLANTIGALTFFLMLFIVIASQLTISTAVLPDYLPNATCNTDYRAVLEAGGGYEPFKWEIVDGALPEGLFLTKTGLIKGAPGEEGKYHFMVRVTDAEGNRGLRDLILQVHQNGTIKNPLRIVSDALPDAFTGAQYRATLAATGGLGQYNWTVDGDLPPGLTLEDGRITGVPMSKGAWQFKITVEDEQSTRKTQSLSLTTL